MGPALERWLTRLSEFQRRRGAGQVARPWESLNEIANAVDELALEGLDSRSAADCLVQLERAALHYEQREFDEALNISQSVTPTIRLLGPAAELFHCNRELLIGNIFLVRDSNPAAAAPHFQAAIDASGPATTFIAGNAAINLGICQSILDQSEEALRSYELARDRYEQAGRIDKVAVALHSIGNACRNLGRIDEGVRRLHEAITICSQHQNHMGIWGTADDLSRAYLILAELRPNERDRWLKLATDASNLALAAGTEVWNVLRNEPGRLADLSDQMVNHTATRLEIAALNDDPSDCVGTLSLMKGRIRLTRDPIPTSFLAKQPSDLLAPLEAGMPWAFFQVVGNALDSLRHGKNVALLDYFALRGNELMIGYAIISGNERRLGAFHNGLPETSRYDPSLDLRGRGRGGELLHECQHLINTIRSHSSRCAMVLPTDIGRADPATQRQLTAWSAELDPALARLGETFLPSEILDELRACAVDHVILCIDPLFARVPYSALLGKYGAILDEPWTLSMVTCGTELIRIAERQSSSNFEPTELQWFGPDQDVNNNRGGDVELRMLQDVADVKALVGDEATLQAMTAALSNGNWCHFRGHGRWTGSVHTSGPVMATDEVLVSRGYDQITPSSSFLFTAACLTGFGEAVGAELVGSLIDYDRAGLLGAVLTNWPIHGDAATVFTTAFYEELRRSGDAALALKHAAISTRTLLPHPYIWAPFALLGGWRAGSMIRWK